MAKLAEIYSENRIVVLKLIFFSILMVLIPLGVFAGIYFASSLDNPNALATSGIGAVIALNMVIVAYIVMAWREDSTKND